MFAVETAFKEKYACRCRLAGKDVVTVKRQRQKAELLSVLKKMTFERTELKKLTREMRYSLVLEDDVLLAEDVTRLVQRAELK